jgi:uncharacterized protein (TIGR03437 family)
MYAGAVTGGIWKTVDGGLNWSLLTDPSANITVGPANLYPGLTVPAQAGNLIELYGTGFGPTNPTTNFGQTFSGAPPTVNTVTCTIGGVPATVQFAGLVAPGEYQLNIVVPPGLPPGDNLLVLTVGGVTTQANAYLAVQ